MGKLEPLTWSGAAVLVFECSWLARLLANALVLGLSPALTVPKSLLLYRWLAYTCSE